MFVSLHHKFINTVNKYLPFYRRNLILALPIILSQLGQIIVQQVDIMMVGYIGTPQLAAAAFANSIFILGLIVIMGFTMGITPIIGHNLHNTKRLIAILSNSYLINIVFAIIILLILYTTSFFFEYFGQSTEVVILAKGYYILLVFSIIPLVIFMTNKQFAEGIGDTKNAMYVTISANIINIILNYILIFGHFGFPVLGLYGAGIATLISRLYMAISFIIIFSYNTTFKPYFSKIKYAYINKVWIQRLFSMGAPISTQMLLEVFAFALSAIMVGWIGIIPLAAHQIVLGLASISFMIVGGIGSATTIIVSHKYNIKAYKEIILAATASIHLVLTFMGLAAISFISLKYFLPSLYTQDTSVIELSAKLLIIVGVFQLFDGLQVIMLSILRGLGDVKYSMVYAFIAYIFINIPIGYFLGFTLNYGVQGIWIAFIIGLSSASIMFYYRYKKLRKTLFRKQ